MEGTAQLIPIDTLHDTRLPPLDGLFVGGGFPEACLSELAANGALRAALRHAVESGLPTYAECGGLMLMARGIRWRDRWAPMVGAVVRSVSSGRPRRHSVSQAASSWALCVP